jgi:hypothetical protein
VVFHQQFVEDARIAELAARQHTCFTRAQAIACGFTARMIELRLSSGRWARVGRATYRLTGSPETWRSRLMAATLSAGRRAAASHIAAAALHGIYGFSEGPLEITVPSGHHHRPPGIVVHTSRDLLDVDVCVVDSIRATTPARTLLDLACVVPAWKLQDAYDAALRDGLTSRPYLRWRLQSLRRRGRPGVAALDALLAGDDKGARPGSRYERRLERAIIEAGLPPPERQFVVRDRGRFLGRVDLAYPDHKIAIEIDGHGSHATRSERRHDAARKRRIELRGWRVMTFITDEVWEELERCVEDIRAELRRHAA